MRIDANRHSIQIGADSEMQVAYLEDTMKLGVDSTLHCVRVEKNPNSCDHATFYLVPSVKKTGFVEIEVGKIEALEKEIMWLRAKMSLLEQIETFTMRLREAKKAKRHKEAKLWEEKLFNYIIKG